MLATAVMSSRIKVSQISIKNVNYAKHFCTNQLRWQQHLLQIAITTKQLIQRWFRT